jgi:hypothetical protein
MAYNLETPLDRLLSHHFERSRLAGGNQDGLKRDSSYWYLVQGDEFTTFG